MDRARQVGDDRGGKTHPTISTGPLKAGGPRLPETFAKHRTGTSERDPQPLRSRTDRPADAVAREQRLLRLEPSLPSGGDGSS